MKKSIIFITTSTMCCLEPLSKQYYRDSIPLQQYFPSLQIPFHLFMFTSNWQAFESDQLYLAYINRR